MHRPGFLRRFLLMLIPLFFLAGFSLVPIKQQQAMQRERAYRYAETRAEALATRPRLAAPRPVVDKAGLTQESKELWQVPNLGLDFAPDMARAHATLARAAHREILKLAREGYSFAEIQIVCPRASAESEFLSPGRLVTEFRSRGLRATTLASQRMDALRLELSGERFASGLTELRLASTTFAGDDRIDLRVAIEGEDWDLPIEAPQRNYYRSNRKTMEMRFLTSPTFVREDAVEDAIDRLAERVRDEVVLAAMNRGLVAPEDEAELAVRLSSQYSRDYLVNMGEYRVEPNRLTLDGNDYWRCKVAWVGYEEEVVDMATNLSRAMGAQRREPWVKLGLAVGAVIASFLGWLKVDWMLKGHYSWTTKLAFLALAASIVGLIWSVSFNV